MTNPSGLEAYVRAAKPVWKGWVDIWPPFRDGSCSNGGLSSSGNGGELSCVVRVVRESRCAYPVGDSCVVSRSSQVRYEIQFPVSVLRGSAYQTPFVAPVDPAAIIRILLPAGFSVSIANFEESWNGNFSKELLASWIESRALGRQPIGLAQEAPKAEFAIENLDSLVDAINASPYVKSDFLTQLPLLKGGEVVIVPYMTAAQNTLIQSLGAWHQSELSGSTGEGKCYLLLGLSNGSPIGELQLTVPAASFYLPNLPQIMTASGKFTIHRVQ